MTEEKEIELTNGAKIITKSSDPSELRGAPIEEEIKQLYRHSLAPSWQQVEEAWGSLEFKGKPSFEYLEKISKEVEDDIKVYEGLKEHQDEDDEEFCEKTFANIKKYHGQLVKLKEGMVASKNMTFMEGHFLAIENFKKQYGEDAQLPVFYDKHGCLKWANRRARRG